jgi:hypothetical protein
MRRGAYLCLDALDVIGRGGGQDDLVLARVGGEGGGGGGNGLLEGRLGVDLLLGRHLLIKDTKRQTHSEDTVASL